MKSYQYIVGIMILGCLTFATFASALTPNLFPDTPQFPRIETSTGTLGTIFERLLGVGFGGDGTLPNTVKLGGYTPVEVLKNKTCTDPTEVWTGIALDGTPLCWTKTHLLAAFWTLADLSWTVDIYRGSVGWISGYNGMIVQEEDIIRTQPASEVAVQFYDSSILRLYLDTTVRLEEGLNMSSQPVAQVILQQWSLWWRVLTSTGMNFWTNEYIAWVRGTSIAMRLWFPWSSLNVSIPHSMHNWPFDVAAYLKDTNSGTSTPMFSQEMTYVSPNFSSFPMAQQASFFYFDPWIRENTLKDLQYFRTQLSRLATGSQLYTRTKNELLATLPPTSDPSASMSICYSNTTGSIGQKIFWSSLVNISNELCREQSLLALLDFSDFSTDATLYTQTGWISPSDGSMYELRGGTSSGLFIPATNTNGYSWVLIYNVSNLFPNVRKIWVEFYGSINTNSIGMTFMISGTTCTVAWINSVSHWQITPSKSPCNDFTFDRDSSTWFRIQSSTWARIDVLSIGNKQNASGPGINAYLKNAYIQQ
jgi:hypothetical protein